jgi:chromosome segregation ATPase
MKNANMHMDDNASKCKKPGGNQFSNKATKAKKSGRKPLSQTNPSLEALSQTNPPLEAGVEAVKMPKTSKQRQKSENSEEKVDSSRSQSDGLREHSLPTKSAEKYRDLRRDSLIDKYRALRRDYSILEEEYSSLINEQKQTGRDIKKLKAQKRWLLDKIAEFEGSVEDPDF